MKLFMKKKNYLLVVMYIDKLCYETSLTHTKHIIAWNRSYKLFEINNQVSPMSIRYFWIPKYINTYKYAI